MLSLKFEVSTMRVYFKVSSYLKTYQIKGKNLSTPMWEERIFSQLILVVGDSS